MAIWPDTHGNDEILAECKERAKNAPDDSVQTDNLLIAFHYAERYEEPR